MTQTLASTGRVDTLARLMATEDINVVHSVNAHTASFDMSSRTLTLPVWENIGDAVYDMLVGHEVAHALWTPFESTVSFHEDIMSVGDNYGVAKDFVNIVEDARIERMIKAKYPGLRRDFVDGYTEFLNRDFFGIGDQDIADMLFMDRFNIHFKCGVLASVPFSTEEQVFVDRMNKCESWEDVLDLARDMYDYCAETESEQNQPQDEEQNSVETGDGDQDENAPEAGGDSSGNEESDDDATENGGNAEGEEGEDNAPSSGGDSDEGDDDGDGQSAPESKGGDDGAASPAAPTTQTAMDKSMEANTNTDESNQHYYGEIPESNLENTIVPLAKFNSACVANYPSDEERGMIYTDLVAFERDSKKIVGQMSQWFEMKRRADEDRNTMVSLTGEIDLERIVEYRFSEDIFLRNESTPDGQNHGLIVLVDWSGSMSGMCEDTVKQALQLVWFCERVNIPCRVYAFTTACWENRDHMEYGDYGNEKCARWKHINADGARTDGKFHSDDFQLMEFYNSNANARDRKQAQFNMFWLGRDQDGNCQSWVRDRRLTLGGTPLAEAVAVMDTLIPQFKAQHNLQIVNLTIISDGEGSGRLIQSVGQGNYMGKIHVRDPRSRKTFSTDFYSDGVGALLDCIRHRHGVQTLGFYITSAKNRMPRLRGMDYETTEKMEPVFKKEGFVSVDIPGFATYFIMKSTKIENDPLEGLGEDASMTKIKNSFLKGAKALKSTRVVLSKFIDVIA